MANAKQDASVLSRIQAGQMTKSEKRMKAANSIAKSKHNAHMAIKAVRTAHILSLQ